MPTLSSRRTRGKKSLWLTLFPLSILILHGISFAVLPQQFKTTRMQNSTTASQIDDKHNEAEQAIAEILGYPVDTNIAAAAFLADSTGVRGIHFQAYTAATLPGTAATNTVVLVTDLASAPCFARFASGAWTCVGDPSGGFTPGDFGIIGDLHESYDGTIGAGDLGLLTIASATCVNTDVGDLVAVKGAGSAGAMHLTTVASCESGKFRLTDNAAGAVSNVLVQYGSDNEAGYDLLENTIEGLNCDAKIDWGTATYWAKNDASDPTDWWLIDCQITGTGLGGGPGEGNLFFTGNGARIVRHPSVNGTFQASYLESFSSSGIIWDGNNQIISTEKTRKTILQMTNVGRVYLSPDSIVQNGTCCGLITYYDDDRGFTPDVLINGVSFVNNWEVAYQLKGTNWEDGVVHGIGAICRGPNPHPTATDPLTGTMCWAAETDGAPTTPFSMAEYNFSNSYGYFETDGGGSGVQNGHCFSINLAGHDAVIRNIKFTSMTCETGVESGLLATIINGTHDTTVDDSADVDMRGISFRGPNTTLPSDPEIRINSGNTGWTFRKDTLDLSGITLRGFHSSNTRGYFGVQNDWEQVSVCNIQAFPRSTAYTNLVEFTLGNVKAIHQCGLFEDPANRGELINLTNGKNYGFLTGETWLFKRTVPSAGQAVEIGTFIASTGHGAASACYHIAITLEHLPKSWEICASSTDQPGGYTYAAPLTSSSTGSNETFDYDLHVDPGQTGAITRFRVFMVKGAPSADTEFRIAITPMVSRGGLSTEHAPIMFTPSTTAGAVSWPTRVYWGSFGNYAVFRRYLSFAEIVTAGTDHDTTILQFDRQYKIVDAYLDVKTAYNCASVCTTSTLTQDLGTSAGGQEVIVDSDIDAAAAVFGDADAELGTSFNRANAVQGGFIPSWGSGATLTVRTTSGTGNLGNGTASNLDAGETYVYVGVKKLR